MSETTIARLTRENEADIAEAAHGLLDQIDTLKRESALLREYVALLERTTGEFETFARSHGIEPAPDDVSEGQRLRAAIAETMGDSDE